MRLLVRIFALLFIALTAHGETLSDRYGESLVGYWGADGYANSDTAGATMHDASGRGNDGTAEGDAYFDGDAMVFDGVDDGVKISNTVLSSGQDKVTVSAWIYITGNANNSYERYVDIQDGSGGNSLILYWDDDDKEYGFRGFGNFATVTGQDPPQGQWMHWVGVMDGSDAKFYLDGDLQATASISGTTADSVVAIGTKYSASGDEAMAKIADVTIFNRALSEKEITWLYHNVRPEGVLQ